MSTASTSIALGYSDVPPGHVASVVTCLEMRSKPQQETLPLPEGITLAPLVNVDLVAYRALFRKIGAKWLWFSRLYMADDKLTAILNDPNVEAWVIRDGAEDIGMLELDFSEPGQCELVFLGLVEGTTGKGLGRAIMSRATEHAFAKPIERFWVHTCTFDHPSALNFYIRSGFVPYAFQVEVQADPRLTGHLPADAAPHIPLIR
ncbi:GNAT family N-acetyltransferase [Phytobacter diazotrophicus]|uniref:GNAT family N-acetyltransferase n=1 Tax=Phytobacter diazotrophicus TaxID=395631 RepID=UPI0029132C71|nr:GNAT family N-acetyltransferase [Phytobacter diazotrophicus]MDU7200469.1 GNAT family N-acetyltransferase [Enterobacteriaceae bacterium]MDV2876641.1 GNAT family N-acetyltransferase [Phytobacter diazotrophicus]